MDRYVDGDERAFLELHGQLHPIIRRQIRSKIRDGAAVEDLLQTTFLKAHVARFRFAVVGNDDRDKAVAVWYATIARNATIDYLRRKGRERESYGSCGRFGAEDPHVLLSTISDPRPNGELAVMEAQERIDLRERVRDGIRRLPKGQREVVEMHKLQGLSISEISARTQVREGTLRVRAHRAYQSLAELLRPQVLAHGLN